MNAVPASEIHFSACPHDCPSTCALEIERLDPWRIGRVRGAAANDYTAGVVCSKVARYAERAHHPDRLTRPLRRTSRGTFAPIGWDEALDEVAGAFQRAADRYGSETVWPYYYAGTMGLVQRDGINRLRHAMRYSGQHSTICTTLAWNGFIAGTGRLAGADPREMAKSDLVIIWGTNAASTQVNVMTHALRARRERGAKIVCVDVYRQATAKQADLLVCVRPRYRRRARVRLDACPVPGRPCGPGVPRALHRLPGGARVPSGGEDPRVGIRDHRGPGRYDRDARGDDRHDPRTFFRLGYGFSRQRNGAVNMHAALSVAAVSGAWRHEGGGAFHNNGAIYHWDRSLIEGLDVRDPGVRVLDQSRIGPVLTGDRRDLGDGPPVTAMLIQNTNPMMVAPELGLVHEGFARQDLFVCVHEQFMTETAEVADVVLPATMFVEHDDIYQGGGHQYIILGPKIIEPPGECRPNHAVIRELARRLGAEHPGFELTEREIIDRTLALSRWPGLEVLEREHWLDCQPPFEEAHYLEGFAHPDGKFRFAPDWAATRPHGFGPNGEAGEMPRLPDHWPVIEEASESMPFRLVTAPARHYLNSSFTETPTSIRRQKRPSVMIHPHDAERLGLADGDLATLGNDRGRVRIHVERFDGVLRGVVVVESIWPNKAFHDGIGINALTGADPAAPVGGAPFHDNRIWIEAG